MVEQEEIVSNKLKKLLDFYKFLRTSKSITQGIDFIAVSVEQHMLSITKGAKQSLSYTWNKITKHASTKKDLESKSVYFHQSSNTKLTITCYMGEWLINGY